MKPRLSHSISLLVLIFLLSLLGACAAVTPEKNYSESAAAIRYHQIMEAHPYSTLASHDLPEGISAFRDLTYISYDERDLQLDLYAPATTMDELRPGIVLVHGGDWVAGERQLLAPLALQFALRGYVVATIDYRRAREAKYPAAIHDVKAALRWLRSNAPQYGVDAQHIAVGGTGAGGHIASLAGLTDGVEIFDPQSRSTTISNKAQVIFNIDGLLDLGAQTLSASESKNHSASVALWLGNDLQQEQQAGLRHQASPINHVQKGSPPFMLLKSENEKYSLGSEEMMKRLHHFRVPHRVEQLPNAPHEFWLFAPWVSPAANLIADFLDMQFKYRMTCH